MEFLQRARDGYDAMAEGYAKQFGNHLDGKPVELGMFSAFASLVRATGNTAVVDIGCGTGVATGMLREHGLEPTGVDLSPNMIEQARLRLPDVLFAVGSMTDLDLPDDQFGGVCAWYSTIHVPDSHLPQTFSEFRRVLAPGGFALLAFQVGDQPRHLTEAFGASVDVFFHRRRPAAVASELAAAGLPVYAQTVRESNGDGVESTPQAFLIARKPVAGQNRASARL
ncbi:class I SAM-dependent methyltransferase [Mycobacterium sp. URHB0044]|jgi:ubiquinone/menaquinone biosynthesis C-methylase UbiE|uniref:class I SAM-dependent methyltransferase n=1 Tax=Mycobacterium sp. URHB0044 TaxID=1380386 RepID=UPI0007E8D9DB|nr:class I SAM-dependent methyltransferase [Mycobacterium sp. URHB0044]